MDEENPQKNTSDSIKCVLSPENSDFELDILQSGYEVQSIRQSGFEWLWKAAKTNFAVLGGKFMYEVKIKEYTEPVPYVGNMHREKQKLRKYLKFLIILFKFFIPSSDRDDGDL